MSDWKNVQYKDGKFKTGAGGGGGSSTFAGLDDVNFSNLQDGQVVKYDAQNQKWVNADESGGGGTVTDVEVDGVSVVNAQGVAEIPAIPTVNVNGVEVNGTSVVNQNKVAQIVSYKEVTQSQYNALPASKESDGVLYCIKDAPSGTPTHHYSTSEQVIGTWIDGKPLYEITIPTGTIPTGTIPDTSSINLSTPNNINEIIHYYGYVKNNSDTSNQRPLPNSGGGVNDIRVDLNNGVLRIVTYGTWNNYSGYLIIQYTKTTD